MSTKSIKDHTLNIADQKYYYRLYESPDARGWVTIIHGIGEHSGRYHAFAEHLSDNKLSVLVFDLRGHGRSGGQRGYVSRFSDYIQDLECFTRITSKLAGGKKVILIGHSLGALIGLHYVSGEFNKIAGFICLSPPLATRKKIPFLKGYLAKIISPILPRLAFQDDLITSAMLSRDREIVRAVDNDPLYHKQRSVRLVSEFLKNEESIHERAKNIRLPVLFAQGGNDLVCSPEALKGFFPLVNSPDKKLKMYDGYYHELLNEIGKETVYNDILDWIHKH